MMASKRRTPKRRRLPGETYASDVPKVRDWIAYDLIPREIAQFRAQIASETDPRQRALHQASLLTCATDVESLTAEDAHLWWVTPSMTKMAAEAAVMMPEWTPAAARPARHGVVMWARGTGLSVERGAHILGTTWLSTGDGDIFLTPITGGGDGPVGIDYRASDVAAWGDPAEDLNPGHADRLWRILGATWLLAQSPTVGVTHGVRYWRRDPERPFAKPTLPGQITTVTLREADDGAPEINGQKRGTLTHQHIVRGHWRQQACGPKREWRKPVYIAPYVKGPAGTELVTKPTVHVWRR